MDKAWVWVLCLLTPGHCIGQGNEDGFGNSNHTRKDKFKEPCHLCGNEKPVSASSSIKFIDIGLFVIFLYHFLCVKGI